MMGRGLTLGKYAPLHAGHQYVIETALAEVDELVILIYEAPESSVPLPVRSAWLRDLYPSADVREAWAGPTAAGYEPDLMKAHEQYVIDTIGIRGITHFYCSEPYGAHMSRALGATDRRVDCARTRYPISGSQIREDPFSHRQFLHPRVYQDHIVRVAVLGAPGTGKSTLCERLAEEFQTAWMHEYGREYWEENQVDRRLSADQLVEIAAEHIKGEDVLAQQANRYLFVDTNAITTVTFARYYHGSVSERLMAFASGCSSRYDLTFVCDADIPYADTWDRSGDANREAFQKQVLADLASRNVPYILLRGALEERVAQVRAKLDGFRKYQNLLDLDR
jgi:HTH-type transcriptional regulator, transcriptional repressor of NAD biosynthesis genes